MTAAIVKVYQVGEGSGGNVRGKQKVRMGDGSGTVWQTTETLVVPFIIRWMKTVSDGGLEMDKKQLTKVEIEMENCWFEGNETWQRKENPFAKWQNGFVWKQIAN